MKIISGRLYLVGKEMGRKRRVPVLGGGGPHKRQCSSEEYMNFSAPRVQAVLGINTEGARGTCGCRVAGDQAFSDTGAGATAGRWPWLPPLPPASVAGVPSAPPASINRILARTLACAGVSPGRPALGISPNLCWQLISNVPQQRGLAPAGGAHLKMEELLIHHTHQTHRVRQPEQVPAKRRRQGGRG